MDPVTFDPLDSLDHDVDVNRYLGFDEPCWRLLLNNYVCPQYDVVPFEDNGETVGQTAYPRNGFALLFTLPS